MKGLQQMSLVESRRYPRVTANNSVRIWSPAIDDGHVMGTLEQLSFGGCLFNTVVAFDAGRVLTLKIDVGGNELVAVGEVIYQRIKQEDGSSVSGVRFEYLSHADQEQLKTLIAASQDQVA